MRASGLLRPIMMTALAMVVLIGLGTWQLQRREWKLDLIERIAARAHAEPVPFADVLAQWRQTGDVEYRHVSVRGRFLNDRERTMFTTRDGAAGWDVFTPLMTPDGVMVLVNRGFVPADLKDPARRKSGLIEGPVEVLGLVRQAHAGKAWFEPDNDVARNQWYWPDLAALTASVSPGPLSGAAPFFVYADATPMPGGWPRGGASRLNLPNRHLEYALTWFGLAVTLMAVFGIYARTRQHTRAPAEQPGIEPGL